MIRASAPNKLILCGEHYVVYGAPAISIPTDSRNTVELEETNSDEIVLETNFGNGSISKDGEFSGQKVIECLHAVHKYVFSKSKNKKFTGFKAKFHHSGAPKGMGNSASAAAAFSVALCKLYGIKADKKFLFDATQAGEEISHGGLPSGIDAATVVEGRPQIFEKKFNPTKCVMKSVNLVLPHGTCFLVVDTFKNARDTTADQIQKFAVANKIEKPPDKLTSAIRNALFVEYEHIYKGVLAELKPNGNGARLGDLLNKNHELLRAAGVSTYEIEDARNIAICKNAYGAKLTGAGGRGGALLVYCKIRAAKSIVKGLSLGGFRSFETRIGTEGPKLEI
ncbi:Mevalonate kinase [Candidatus Gugararchaeum adminiculabundum]|nr:Mevalonate kinase [Candidatus Gugararchaeum adminiculabundum]